MKIEKAEKKKEKKKDISISEHEIGFLKVHRFIPLRILWEQESCGAKLITNRSNCLDVKKYSQKLRKIHRRMSVKKHLF